MIRNHLTVAKKRQHGRKSHKVLKTCSFRVELPRTETCSGMTKLIGSWGIWMPVWWNKLFITAHIASFMSSLWGMERHGSALVGDLDEQCGHQEVKFTRRWDSGLKLSYRHLLFDKHTYFSLIMCRGNDDSRREVV